MIVGFKGLKIECIIGVNPEERVNKQTILVDLEVKIPSDRNSFEDSLVNTVDYTKLASICNELATTKEFFLIETLAHSVLKDVLNTFHVLEAKIRVEKPAAIPGATCAFVELQKELS